MPCRCDAVQPHRTATSGTMSRPIFIIQEKASYHGQRFFPNRSKHIRSGFPLSAFHFFAIYLFAFAFLLPPSANPFRFTRPNTFQSSVQTSMFDAQSPQSRFCLSGFAVRCFFLFLLLLRLLLHLFPHRLHLRHRNVPPEHDLRMLLHVPQNNRRNQPRILNGLRRRTGSR